MSDTFNGDEKDEAEATSADPGSLLVDEIDSTNLDTIKGTIFARVESLDQIRKSILEINIGDVDIDSPRHPNLC